MKLRLFLTCWVLISLHLATNVVREHYPAFSLVEHGTFQLDDYAGLHPDIFEHTDGHHYVGNQVAGSVVAAVPLLLFDPVLDALEDVRERDLARDDLPEGEYRTEYPLRAAFYQKVKERGLDLRFGGATVVTTVFLMAPLCAAFTVLMFGVLIGRGVARRRALWLSLLFLFGTPLFYRSVSLNHNVMLMCAAFGAFLCLWPRDRLAVPFSTRRAAWAGFLSGACVALDYAGVVLSLVMFGYLLATHARSGSLARVGIAFTLGAVPPGVFLLYSQWAMYGNPFLPGQFWMPHQNEFVGEGVRGFTGPDAELFWLNLAAPGYGMLWWAPLLVLALLPAWRSAGDRMVLPRRERDLVAVLALLFLLFCCCNQYSRLQWNTGFRYLLPLVPFLFLAAADHLARMPTLLLSALSAVVVLHSWVLTMVRHVGDGDDVLAENWGRFLRDGVQLPWLTVARNTPSLSFEWLGSAWLPSCVLFLAALLIAAIWSVGRGRSRLDARS